DRRRRAVRGDQLLRGGRQRGENRLQRRPEERRGDADDSRQREDERLASPDEEGDGRATERARAGERDRQQEALAAEAVAKAARERGEECGRQHADEPGDPDSGGPAGVI